MIWQLLSVPWKYTIVDLFLKDLQHYTHLLTRMQSFYCIILWVPFLYQMTILRTRLNYGSYNLTTPSQTENVTWYRCFQFLVSRFLVILSHVGETVPVSFLRYHNKIFDILTCLLPFSFASSQWLIVGHIIK